MDNSYDFLKLVLDSVSEHIVVINEQGDIQYTNKSWVDFGSQNSCQITSSWQQHNYLTECDKSAANGDLLAKKAASGIRRVIEGREPLFYFEYPCHSPIAQRWFMMRVTPFTLATTRYFVISHHNITERRIAEEQVKKLAQLDGLTDIPNRRSLNEFIRQEWRRCRRMGKPICIVIIDIDYFKLLNDHFGHQAGDSYLKKVAKSLHQFTKRPGDICARYGGEEFAIIWGDISQPEALKMANHVMRKIAQLKIPNPRSPISEYLSVSLGLSFMIPSKENSIHELISQADHMLYKAKENGRNRIEYEGKREQALHE
jgi:diguanylate cyclase (GGDEF)-like protein